MSAAVEVARKAGASKVKVTVEVDLPQARSAEEQPGEEVEGTEDGEAARTPMPSMQGSSKTELLYIAHIGDMLHATGLLDQPIDAETLAGWLVKGKAALKTDARLLLSHHGAAPIDLLLEVDPGFTHPPERVTNDVKKTTHLLAAYPDAVVLRLRIDAVPLPPFDSSNVAVVHVGTCVPYKSMSAVAKALSVHAAEPYKSRLLAFNGRRQPACLS